MPEIDSGFDNSAKKDPEGATALSFLRKVLQINGRDDLSQVFVTVVKVYMSLDKCFSCRH